MYDKYLAPSPQKSNWQIYQPVVLLQCAVEIRSSFNRFGVAADLKEEEDFTLMHRITKKDEFIRTLGIKLRH